MRGCYFIAARMVNVVRKSGLPVSFSLFTEHNRTGDCVRPDGGAAVGRKALASARPWHAAAPPNPPLPMLFFRCGIIRPALPLTRPNLTDQRNAFNLLHKVKLKCSILLVVFRLPNVRYSGYEARHPVFNLT